MNKMENIICSKKSYNALEESVKFLEHIAQGALTFYSESFSDKWAHTNPYNLAGFPAKLCWEFCERILGKEELISLIKIKGKSIYGKFPCKPSEYYLEGFEATRARISSALASKVEVRAWGVNTNWLYQFSNPGVLIGTSLYYKRGINFIKLENITSYDEVDLFNEKH